MIQLNSNKMVRVELTPKEQKTILKYCRSIDRDIYGRIMDSTDGTLHLLVEDCHYLRGCIQLEIDRITIPKIQNILGKVFNKLSMNPVTRDISDKIEGLDFENIDDLNDHLQEIMVGRNAAPDPEMGGLSPDQVSRLLYSNWDDENCPITFNKTLTVDDLIHSPFFHNARLLLNTLVQMEKENTATTKGNLTRKVVKVVFDKMIIPKAKKEFILNYNKVINELDVKPLHYIRVVCESTGMITCQKKKFIVEDKYIELLDDQNAGELFYRLFFGYFRKFNIAYVDRMTEFDCIQDTLPYSLYRLSKIGKKQVRVSQLKKQLFLPAVLNELIDEYGFNADPVDEITWLVEFRIIKPLELFGMVECRYKEKFKNHMVIDQVKKTKLFDKFMKFEV